MKKNNGNFRRMGLPLVFSFFSFSLVFLIVFFLNAPFSLGHATPVSYNPDSEILLTETPPQIEVLFTERIEPKASSLVILGPNGNYADKGNAEVDTSNPRLTRVGVEDRGEGSYTLLWKVVSSDDGHFTQGAYVFVVGNSTENGGAVADIHYHSSLLEGASQWLELMGFALIAALVMLLSFALLNNANPLEMAGKRTLFTIFLIALILIFAGNLWYVYIKSHTLAEAYETGILSVLPLFFSTVAGKAIIARLGIVVAMATLLFIGMRKGMGKKIVFGILALFGALMIARVVSSHGAASLILPTFTFIDHAIHLLSKMVWVGGVLMMALLPWMFTKQSGNVHRENGKAMKFLAIAVATSIGVAGVTGAYILWLDLKDFSLLLSSAWGRAFISLMAVSTLFVALRLINAFLIRRGGNERKRSFSCSLEAALGIGMLFFTVIIMSTTPPVYLANTFEKALEDSGVSLRLIEHPVEQNRFLIEIEGSDANVRSIVATASESGKGIGPVLIAPVERFDDGFSFPKSDISLPGTWDIEVIAQRENAYDAHARFSLDYPSEIEAGRITHHRSFGFFEWFAAGFGAITVMLSIILFILAGKTDAGSIEKLSLSTMKRTLGIGLIIGFFLCAGVFWVQGQVISDFQKECESSGGSWHEMISIRDGKSIGSLPREGCMSSDGRNHFADQREYDWFLAQRSIA